MADKKQDVDDVSADAASADTHALREQQKRLRLSSGPMNMKEFDTWTLVNHHRAIVYLLSCLAGVEVWGTDKTSTFHMEGRLLESYRR